MTKAPIALFVYNRPEHTRITFDSLIANLGFSDSRIYIFCDGPKKKKDIPAVQATRELMRSYELPNATLLESGHNIGLANSIIAGVTELCDRYGKVIVLEDDLDISPYYLEYMNMALAKYEKNELVMHISGYMFPVNGELPETFFYRVPSSWGWATWKRAWDQFRPDAHELLADFKDTRKRWEFDIQGSMDFYKMLRHQTEGKIDSWAIRWYASVFLNRGLCLHPGKSLVNNIGHDGTGVHCDETDVYDVQYNDHKILDFTQDIYENEEAIKLMAEYYRSIRKPIFIQAYYKAKRIVKKYK